MTIPNDLIRRGDALDQTRDPFGKETTTSKAINAIPAAPDTPEVLALVEALRKIARQPDFRLPSHQAIAQDAIAAWEASHDR